MWFISSRRHREELAAARWWNTPVRETGPYGDDHDTVVTPIADLMGAWEWDWEPEYGIALEQARGGRT